MPSENFRSALLEIDANLDSTDLNCMKFLCKDILPGGALEQCSRCLDVFAILEQKGKLRDDKTVLLQECFHYMQRKDLVRKLGGDPSTLEKRVETEGPYELRPFRILLFEISEDCGTKEFEDMKFYARNSIGLKKKLLDKVKSCLDLFDILEKEEHLTHIDVTTLEQLIKATGDEELMDYLYQYKNKNLVTSPTDELIQQQIHQNPVPHEPVPNTQQCTTENQYPRLHGSTQNSRNCSSTYAVNNRNQISENHTNLPVQSEGTHLENYPSLSSMTSPARDAMDTLMSGQLSENPITPTTPVSPEEEVHESMHSLYSYYKLTAKPRGLCIIINNKFAGTERERQGTDVDENHLKDVFEKTLSFIVKSHPNCTCEEIRKICEIYSKWDHSKFDTIAFCLLSHGKNGEIYGSDNRTIRIKDITSYFTASKCETLADKPKLFFFQACQGTDHQQGFKRPGPRNVDLETDSNVDPPSLGTMIPDESDFLFGFSTVPGYVSYRSRSKGSFYITTLVSKLKEYAFRYDLLDILISVNKAVSELNIPDADMIYKQVPAPQFTLTKKVQFDKS